MATTTYLVSSIVFNPTTLTGGATTIPLTDDSVSSAIPLPFTFTFFGVDYTDIYVGSNGLVGFNPDGMDFNSASNPIPDGDTPHAQIYLFWDDMNPEAGGTIAYETFGSVGNRVFVINYDQVPQFSDNLVLYTFQVKLFESNHRIEIHTTSANSTGDGDSIVQGIENEDSTVAFYLAGRNYVQDLVITNDAVRFSIEDTSNFFSQNIFFVGSDTEGTVQLMNAGKDDDGSPLYYELETQELEFGNRGHLKKISDEIGLLSTDGLDSNLSVCSDIKDYFPVPMDMSKRVSIGKSIDTEGHYFTFKWFGQVNESSPILEGIYVENITDLGMTQS